MLSIKMLVGAYTIDNRLQFGNLSNTDVERNFLGTLLNDPSLLDKLGMLGKNFLIQLISPTLQLLCCMRLFRSFLTDMVPML